MLQCEMESERRNEAVLVIQRSEERSFSLAMWRSGKFLFSKDLATIFSH